MRNLIWIAAWCGAGVAVATSAAGSGHVVLGLVGCGACGLAAGVGIVGLWERVLKSTGTY
jgi:hypothetical protein